MKEKKLKLFYTSDVHGFLFPTDYTRTEKQDIGLMHCGANFEKDGNTLVIDGGDMLQGSPFTFYCQKVLHSSKPIAELVNTLGYDFVTIGNHDFNYGMDYLNEYINSLKAVCVCENVKESGTGSIGHPYVVHKMKNGLRVGIIGIVTEFVAIWEKEENLKGIQITEPLDAARKALEQVRKEADITICLYHGGFERNLKTGELVSKTKENIGWKICEELDFDILLSAHQHMTIEGEIIHGTYVVQLPDKAANYLYMEVQVDEQGKRIQSEIRKAGSKCIAVVPDIVRKTEEQVQIWLDNPIGSLNKKLVPRDKLDMALYGSEIADFINQIQLYYSGAQISCTSLANEIAGFCEKVSVREVMTNYPYSNTLVVLEVSGKLLKEGLERTAEYFSVDENGICISQSFLNPKKEHYNYDYFAGIQYVIQVNRPVGQRVTEILYEGKAVEENAFYQVCMNSYRASGAGGYDGYRTCRVRKEINVEMSELIMEYLRTQREVTVNNYFLFKVDIMKL
ncbi:bifunctional metallophosphatase/5'-nucleotidase [Anaeromicropila populeti]|uniref:2',3'-cyclic-nucleotide 2'-phosphodiesterase / 3'-nucleotidase n=1 Tax=Anaeromicropila populeti TaxID=37658 RepID=A0A1I6ISH5_9FIRM|nr:bifunctional UDP-sugar hydrolase/5'-nucleotidase [Anaeromicropila populeti]SFR69682.1 2',3'-cyclic-nucleotide 2'-phosphodiesterase / 3'-nucleotidase [Anaeromicropila populeti]